MSSLCFLDKLRILCYIVIKNVFNAKTLKPDLKWQNWPKKNYKMFKCKIKVIFYNLDNQRLNLKLRSYNVAI